MKNFFRKIKNAVMFAVEVQRMLLAPTCRAPFEPGSIARAHGLSPKNESEALALCVQHGIDNEVATADTLAQLAATFDI